MGRKSKSKCARGELELAKLLQDLFGFDTKRSRQYMGSPDSPDIIGVPGLHVECKRTERFRLYPSLHQAEKDAGDNVPAVFHRMNREDWVVVIKVEDIKRFCEAINGQ